MGAQPPVTLVAHGRTRSGRTQNVLPRTPCECRLAQLVGSTMRHHFLASCVLPGGIHTWSACFWCGVMISTPATREQAHSVCFVPPFASCAAAIISTTCAPPLLASLHAASASVCAHSCAAAECLSCDPRRTAPIVLPSHTEALVQLTHTGNCNGDCSRYACVAPSKGKERALTWAREPPHSCG